MKPDSFLNVLQSLTTGSIFLVPAALFHRITLSAVVGDWNLSRLQGYCGTFHIGMFQQQRPIFDWTEHISGAGTVRV